MSNIQVTVNGEKQEMQPGRTVLEFLQQLEITPDRVAVELNRAIVRKAEWERTVIEPGSQLEIVQFVGGG